MTKGIPWLRVAVEGIVIDALALAEFARAGGSAAPPIAFLRSDVGRNYTALRAQAETFSVRDGEILLTAISELLRRIEEELD